MPAKKIKKIINKKQPSNKKITKAKKRSRKTATVLATKNKAVAKKKVITKKKLVRKKKVITKKKTVTKKKAFQIILQPKSPKLTTSNAQEIKKVNYSTVNKMASQHIVDLKKINFHKESENYTKKKYTNDLKECFSDKIHFDNIKIKQLTKKAFLTLPRKTKKDSFDILSFEYPKETTIIALEGHQLIEDSIKRSQQKSKKSIKLGNIRLPKINIKVIRIQLSPYAQKAIASFVIASFILTSPLLAFDYYQKLQDKKGTVLGVTYQAIDHIKTSTKTSGYKDYIATEYEISKANESFKLAQNELKNINPILSSIAKALPNSQLQTAEQLLYVGEKTTNILGEALNIINNKNNGNLSESLVDLIDLLSKNKNDIKEIIKITENIDIKSIPKEYQDKFNQITSLLPILGQNVDLILENSEFIVKLLGKDQPKRYLILFQNNDELRATGGFIGSYAELNLNKGVITNINIPYGGIYDLKSGLDINVIPPKAISILNNKWEIQDANYFPDFAKSAQTIQNFYEHSGGTTTDGVIAINATLMEQLLKVTGPIGVPEYNEVISSDNFISKAEYYAELSDDKLNNAPKKFLSLLTPRILEKIITLRGVSLIDLLKTFSVALSEKELQMYFTDSNLQDFAKSNKWTGEILNTPKDYLNIVSTNIAGGKTNLSIDDQVTINVDINVNGDAINTVHILRTHNGIKGDPLSGVKNNDYIRFYVPLGSELISAVGFEPIPDSEFNESNYSSLQLDKNLIIENSTKTIDDKSKTEIYQENNKTVFANWIQVEAGETISATIKYKIPINIKSKNESSSWIELISNEFNLNKTTYESYSLLLQKQSGKINQSYNVIINKPDGFKYVWAYPSQLNIDENQFSLVNYPLVKDTFIALILDEK